jgi:undecaprenyl-diphosphatase
MVGKNQGLSLKSMPLLHIAILALVQGITEFLPISSSGHLLLTHKILDGSSDTSAWGTDLILDLAVHVGSLLAVLLYFRKEVLKMLLGIPPLLKGDLSDTGARFNSYLIIGSIPALAAGLMLHHYQPEWLRSVEIVAWCTLIFGALLWIVDAKAPVRREIKDLRKREALLIGLAQAVALIPGTSRSGITMTAARGLGLSRTEAAQFSFLLSIIATAAAGTVGAIDLYQVGNVELTYDAAVAVVLSFLASLATIAFLMKMLQRWTFKPFAIYRIGLAIILLGLIYSGYLDDAVASISSVSP